MPKTVHEEEFPGFPVSPRIDKVVKEGLLEDTSYMTDVSPSFGTRLSDGSLLRLWAGHPNKARRGPGVKRYVVQIQPDFGEPAERVIIETDDVEEALFHLENTIDRVGAKKPRFRLLGWGRKA